MITPTIFIWSCREKAHDKRIQSWKFKTSSWITNHDSLSQSLWLLVNSIYYLVILNLCGDFGNWCILATTFKRCKLIVLKMSTRVKGFGWFGLSITRNSLQWFSTCLSYVNGKYQIYFSLTNCECRIFLVLAFSYILS